jgi:hypothetical protein
LEVDRFRRNHRATARQITGYGGDADGRRRGVTRAPVISVTLVTEPDRITLAVAWTPGAGGAERVTAGEVV